MDTTSIDLCLSAFSRAPFRSAKAAVKLHTLLDLCGNVPTFIHIKDGKMHGVKIIDQLLAESGVFYVMDRGFLGFERLYRSHEAGRSFVTRGKSNLKVQRRYSHPVDRGTGLICNQTVVLTGFVSHEGFEVPLRHIRFRDPETKKTLIVLTNNFALPALTITELYRCRRQVELIFKWIKQHLRIKTFFDTSEQRSVSSHRQEAPQARRQPLRNPTDAESDYVRKNANGSKPWTSRDRRHRARIRKAVDPVRMTLGQC